MGEWSFDDDGTMKSLSIISTNLVKKALDEQFASLLAGIPNFSERVRTRALNEVTVSKIEAVFSNIGFNPEKTLSHSQATGLQRELARRISNILNSEQYRELSNTLVAYLIHTRRFTEETATQYVGDYLRDGSLCSSLAAKIISEQKKYEKSALEKNSKGIPCLATTGSDLQRQIAVEVFLMDVSFSQ
jgi:hypothetical protein